MHYDMLQKSELKITHITLEHANLHEIASCVAEVYGVARDKVLVIDVRNSEVALDILDDQVNPHCFMAKEEVLLQKLARVSGVTLQKNARVVSDGMLGWIAFRADEETVHRSLQETERLTRMVLEHIEKRVIVFPSGTEIEQGEIEDTNTPLLLSALRDAEFKAKKGVILKDNEDYIVGQMMRAIEKGFGTVITTGGVGAEDKDHSVEAVLRLDPTAATPYIAKFVQGHGRHVKEGIRIAVGEVGGTRIITLPGPNDEVALCVPVLLAGIKSGWKKEQLAEALADVLRERLREKCMHKT